MLLRLFEILKGGFVTGDEDRYLLTPMFTLPKIEGSGDKLIARFKSPIPAEPTGTRSASPRSGTARSSARNSAWRGS